MAWNVFQFCTGLRVVGSIMILVVLAVVAVSYYAVVVSNYALEVLKGGSHTAVALVVLLLFHFLVRKGTIDPTCSVPSHPILILSSTFPFSVAYYRISFHDSLLFSLLDFPA